MDKVVKDGVIYETTEDFWGEGAILKGVKLTAKFKLTTKFKGGEIRIPDKDSKGSKIKMISMDGSLNTNGVKYDLYIPDTVTMIDDYSFSKCAGMGKIFMGKNVCQIGDGAFSGTSADEVYWPDECEAAPWHCFHNAHIKKFIAGKSLKRIDALAFGGCTIDEFDLSNMIYLTEDLVLWPDRYGAQKITLPYYSKVNIGGCGWQRTKNKATIQKDISSMAPSDIKVKIYENTFVVTGGDEEWNEDVKKLIDSHGGYAFTDTFILEDVNYLVVGVRPDEKILKEAQKYRVPTIGIGDLSA